MQSQEAAELSSYVERKEPDAVTKAEAEISELTAGIYFVCKISKLAAEIAGAQSPAPPFRCVVQSTLFGRWLVEVFVPTRCSVWLVGCWRWYLKCWWQVLSLRH